MKNIVIVLALALFCCPVWAIDGDMGGVSQDGSAEHPYLIEDVDDFDVFSGNSSYWASGIHIKLMTDINLSGKTYTSAVIAPDNIVNARFDGTPFSGIFEGNGFCIINLKIDSSNREGLGLFGGNSGFIANLGLENLNITGTKGNFGGLCGWNCSGYINNCYSSGQISGLGNIGGLCGVNSQMSSTLSG